MPAAGAPLKAHSPRPKAHCYSTNVAPSRALSPCRQRRRDAKRRLQHNALQALQIKPSFERGCPVGAGDRMRQSRITSRKNRTRFWLKSQIPLYTYLLKLWLSEPLHHPALRATFFPKKASKGALRSIFICRRRRRGAERRLQHNHRRKAIPLMPTAHSPQLK